MADKTEALDQQPEPQVQQGMESTSEVPQEPTNPPPYERCPCLRCGHVWKARDVHRRPTSCPRCGSALWDKPPVRKNARRPDDPPNPNWKYRLKPIKRPCPTCGRPMTRLTVKERKRLEEKERERLTREAERVATERPARPSAVTISPAYARSLEEQLPGRPTPPPSLRRPAVPTPPPTRPRQAENPETVASRQTLSDELKEKT